MSVAAAVATVAAMIPLFPTSAPPLERQPFPDAAEYADAARQLARGHGSVTYVHGDEPRPPRYPPATLLVVVSAGALGGHWPRAHVGAPKREAP